MADRHTRDGYRQGRGPGESYLAQHPHAPLVWLWRHRWPLTPVLLAGATMAGASAAPARTGLGLAGAAGLMEVAARWPRLRTLGGRAWMSARERRTAAVGLAAAAGWVAATDAGPGLGWRVQAVLLAAVLGVPAATWWGARRPGASKLSPLAARLVADWAPKVAGQAGPKAYWDSTVIAGSVTEPVEGTVTMVVRLAGVHASNATSTQLRRAVEVALGLPMDTVRLDAVRDDGAADRVKVTTRGGGPPHRGVALSSDRDLDPQAGRGDRSVRGEGPGVHPQHHLGDPGRQGRVGPSEQSRSTTLARGSSSPAIRSAASGVPSSAHNTMSAR